MEDERLLSNLDPLETDGSDEEGDVQNLGVDTYINKDNEGFNNKHGLKREIGLLGALTFYVGSIIGSGIFISPTVIAERVHSTGATLLIWTACGAITMLFALAWIELGTMFPNSAGGEYTYLYEAFGALPAFLFSFIKILFVEPGALCLVMLTCAKYIVAAIDSHHKRMEEYEKLIAGGLIAIILIVNCISVKWATNVQGVFTSAKMLAVVIVTITGLVRLGQGYNTSFVDAFNGTTKDISDIGYGFYGGFWAYGGWANLNYIVEELKNPIRDLKLGVIIGISIVTSSYVMVNVAYLTVMTSTEMANSEAVAVTLADNLYGKMAWIIPALVACSTFGSGNSSAFTTARLLHVTARGGHMPKLLAMVHKERHTPIPAVILNCVIACIMLIPKSSNFSTLVNYFGFTTWLFYCATIIALLWLRYKRPDIKRPYKVFIGIPIIGLLSSIYLVAAPFYSYPLQSFYCLLIVLCGVPVYFGFVRYSILPTVINSKYHNIMDKMESWFNLALPEIQQNAEREDKDDDEETSLFKETEFTSS